MRAGWLKWGCLETYYAGVVAEHFHAFNPTRSQDISRGTKHEVLASFSIAGESTAVEDQLQLTTDIDKAPLAGCIMAIHGMCSILQ